MLKDNQYFKEKQFKNQIVIHHTAGSGKASNVIHGWDFNAERVGTSYVIDVSGEVVKAFEPEYWAYHLGLKSISNSQLNKNSIGIEICNWGQLVKKSDGKYYNYVNGVVPESEVVQIPKFRGFEYYHKYNDAQIESLRKLLLELATKFAIPLDYNSDMWDISQNALAGKKGIYTHVSYRTDKNDCSPQFNLIQMLKSLKNE
ncbi:N-acetylmuramoyl-L-alanine amidase domain [uncultured Caudovirales phage]|uniref:N-acetylmuramoyl-L-alanine amidase n=1 Tax=uncultured Caudovirales phage TaxID=2100421 RepID=A0A6J5KXF0_9CAUD|nr:N-acetylmuramoyl-L-alanine amidase domain [uncultured Caudovirales phage]